MSRPPGYSRLDEDDVRVRPGRGSRPRTRRRPAHESAVPAFVTSVDRGRYGCMADGRLVVAMKARELGRGSVVVGDRVALAGDTSGAEGTLARIVRVETRTSALRRSPDDTDPMERIIVANADQMVIVCALAAPPPRLRFVDRCLVAAYDAGLDPLLLLTKADLGSPRRVRALYRPLDLPMLTTRRPLPPRTLARIVRVEPRTSVLRRSPDDTDPAERIIVANADQMVIVCALAQPPPRLRFVDRCLVAAYDAGLDPLLLLTKADLASPRHVRAFYRPLDLPMLTTRRPRPPRTLARVRNVLTGRISVLFGLSGVG